MIDRINFIEKEAIRLTYGLLLKVAGGIVILCLIIYGSQSVRSFYYAKKRDGMRTHVEELRNEKRQLLAQYAPKVEGGPMADIKNNFVNTPPWARLMKDLGDRLPSTIWLTEFRGAAARVPPEAPQLAAATPAVTQAIKGTLVIQGMARDEGDIALLMIHLDQSPFVRNVALEKSEKSGSDFTFVVECDMVVP